MKATYIKLSVQMEKGKEIIFLKNPVMKEMLGTVCMVGLEVDKDGDSILYTGDRTRIIECKLIRSKIPMVMNNHYAMLEEA
jgi:hypothetical protein